MNHRRSIESRERINFSLKVGWEDNWMMQFKSRHYSPKTLSCELCACDRSPYDLCRLCATPAYIPARQKAGTAQKIPRIIFQSWWTRQLGPIGFSRVRSWLDRNPEYEYFLFDDDDIDAFVCENTSPTVQAAFSILGPVARVDLWRFLMMRSYGGVYIDFDADALSPLPIDSDDSVVSGIGGFYNCALEHYALAYVPHHPIVEQMLIEALQKIAFSTAGVVPDHQATHIFNITGPMVYADSFHRAVKQAGCNVPDTSPDCLRGYSKLSEHCSPAGLAVVGKMKLFLGRQEFNGTFATKMQGPNTMDFIHKPVRPMGQYGSMYVEGQKKGARFCHMSERAIRTRSRADEWADILNRSEFGCDEVDVGDAEDDGKEDSESKT